MNPAATVERMAKTDPTGANSVKAAMKALSELRFWDQLKTDDLFDAAQRLSNLTGDDTPEGFVRGFNEVRISSTVLSQLQAYGASL